MSHAFDLLKALSLAVLIVWIIAANLLVFVVLYKNPKLQTVPNLLVGNLAFSDVLVAVIVLPLSATYTVMQRWVFGGVLSDILCCTASIWNLSIVGLDRYWAITNPVGYLQKRNKVTAAKLIVFVWVLSALISLAPLLGWKSSASHGYHTVIANSSFNHTVYSCQFLDLPAYTIYSATGSFFVPSLLMFFVYYKIYNAFAIHRQKALYRQRVIRNHIASTILHKDVSTLMPSKKAFNELDSSSESSSNEEEHTIKKVVCHRTSSSSPGTSKQHAVLRSTQSTRVKTTKTTLSDKRSSSITAPNKTRACVTMKIPEPLNYDVLRGRILVNSNMAKRKASSGEQTFSATKERRGVRVLGIILGCFTLCWTPFFVIYTYSAFCSSYCMTEVHITQFITWLGYSNSAMNPIIYTVFNRDYQNALKRLFGAKTAKRSTRRRRLAMLQA